MQVAQKYIYCMPIQNYNIHLSMIFYCKKTKHGNNVWFL